MRRNHKLISIIFANIAVVSTILILMKTLLPSFTDNARSKLLPNENMLRFWVSEEYVRVDVTPLFNFSFDIMKPGVLQHLDRKYTYDVIPHELLNGLLFQGIHRPPKGTSIKFELLSPAIVYFFFHEQVDGGYVSIFKTLPNWVRCTRFPQYDINNGGHGLRMVMYKLDADAGVYSIPPTIEDRACFNIVFQPKAN